MAVIWSSLVSLLAVVTPSAAPVLHRRQTNNLRVLALGDSITYGMWSNDLNGYRQDLAAMLQYAAYNLEYIGWVQSGSMMNNRSEGHSGAHILEIMKLGFDVFNGTFGIPNVVLLHAGTNDAVAAATSSSLNVNQVATQMINDLKTVIDALFVKAPKTLVVVAQIISNADPTTQSIISQYNGYIPYLLEQYKGGPHNVIGVSMSNVDVNGPDHDSVWPVDPTHPGNIGFQKMAGNFFVGITAADSQGMISPVGSINAGPLIQQSPAFTNPSTNWARQCDYYATWPSYPRNIFGGPPDLATGSQPSWGSAHTLSGVGNGQSVAGQYVYLADINNDGLADLMFVDPNYGTTHAWQNHNGGASWTDMGIIASGSSVYQGATIKYADLNGDGFADFVVHNSSGVYLLYNYYGHGFILEQLVASGFGGSIANTYLADINGDGRADLIWVDGSGNIRAWLNTGQGTGISWNTNVPVLATGAVGGFQEKFVDVDGDGRADWVHIASDGSMTVSLNPDLVGYGAAPSFKPAFPFSPAVGSAPANIVLGDISGDSKADIAMVSRNDGVVNANTNPGMASYGQIRFADGNADGYSDAWLIDTMGNVKVWQNNGGNSFEAKGQVFVGTGLGPKNVQFADLNAVSSTDMVIITQSSAGCTLNAYPGTGNFGFGAPVTVWSGSPPQGCLDCSQIAFTDTDGDGRDDIICVQPDASAWLTYNHNSNLHSLSGINWQYFGWILINQGVPKTQARFVDLNGDGINDVMTIDTGGGVHAFVSGTPSGVNGGVAYFPSSHGISFTNVILADINADARADYLVVDANSGSVSVYINGCLDGGEPRKPWLPRPNSPGTTMSRGPNAPTIAGTDNGGVGSTPDKPPTVIVHQSSPWQTGSSSNIKCGAAPADLSRSGGRKIGDTPGSRAAAIYLWQQAHADETLNNLLQSWDPNTDPSLLSWLTYAITDASTLAQCGTQAGSCFAGVTCAQVGNPALAYIAGSLTNLNTLYQNFLEAYQNAAITTTGLAVDWPKTFATKPAEDKVTDQVIEVLFGFLGMGVGRLLEPLKDKFGEEVAGAAEEASNKAIEAGTKAAQDYFKDEEHADSETTEALAKTMSNVFYAVTNGTLDLLSSLFNGKQVAGLNASLWGGAATYFDTDISTFFTKTATTDLSRHLFQTGWNHSGIKYNVPFVMFVPYYVWDPTGGCKAGDITKIGTVYGNQAAGWPTGFLKPQDDVSGRICDDAGNAYILFNAGHYAAEAPPKNSYFAPFPGMDQLTEGNTAWGGVTQREMAVNAIESWVEAGYSNIRPIPDENHALTPSNASAGPPAGFYQFPVCTSLYDVSVALAHPDDHPDYFPCGVDGNAASSKAAVAYLKNYIGYGYGTCTIKFRVHDGSSPHNVDFQVLDSFGYSYLHTTGSAFDGNNNVVLNAGALGSWSIATGTTKDNKQHETLSFSVTTDGSGKFAGPDRFTSKDSNCDNSFGYNSDKYFWDGSCTFSCAPLAGSGFHHQGIDLRC